MPSTLVILAAGSGSRYGGLKQLDGVGPDGQTLIEYAIRDAVAAGFSRVVLVVRARFAADVRQRIVARLPTSLDIRLALQEPQFGVPGTAPAVRSHPWGTGHAVLCAREHLDSPFAVVNADDWYGPDTYRRMNAFLRERAGARRSALVGFRLDRTLSPNGPVSRGVCELSADGHLIGITERTRIAREGARIVHRDRADGTARELPPDALVSMNCWGLHPGLLPHVQQRFEAHVQRAGADEEFYLPAVMDALLQEGLIRIEAMRSEERWHGMTYPQDRPALQRFLDRLPGRDERAGA